MRTLESFLQKKCAVLAGCAESASTADATSGYTERQLCCSVDATDVDQDGIFGEYYGCTVVTDTTTCVAPNVLVLGYCNTYAADWVFNIADFVQHFWSLDNSGVKLVQVRSIRFLDLQER